MFYSEDFWKGVVVGVRICLLMLSAVIKRRKQQQSAAKTSATARREVPLKDLS